jgi:hypothetical protein
MIKEIGSYLDTKSRQAYRSTHPVIRAQSVPLIQKIRKLVVDKTNQLKRIPLWLWKKNEFNEFIQLIEDMCKIYYGDELEDVYLDEECNDDQLFLEGNIILKNKKKIPIFLGSGMGWQDHLRYVPHWFIDSTKNTNFYDVLDDLEKYHCLELNDDYSFDSWKNYTEDFEESVLKQNIGVFLCYRGDERIPYHLKDDLKVDKFVYPEENKIELIITYRNKEKFKFISDNGKRFIIAKEPALTWLNKNIGSEKSFWETLEKFIHDYDDESDNDE